MSYNDKQISTGFASCLRYGSDVAHWRPTKLFTMFGRLLVWYTRPIYIFWGRLPPDGIFPGEKFTLGLCRRLAILYWQLLHGTPAAGVSQTLQRGTRNGITKFRRGCHLYSAGRLSRWASANILVMVALCNRADHYILDL